MAKSAEVTRLDTLTVARIDTFGSGLRDRDWVSEVERIALATSKLGARTVGLTSPSGGVGCVSLAKLLARNFCCSDWSSLRIDLTQPLTANALADDWIPGKELDGDLISKTPYGFDEVVARPSDVTRPLYNNVDRIRRSLDQDFRGYDRIVASLPPVLEKSGNHINAVSASLACDIVFLVCATGVTTRADVSNAIDQLEAAGSNIVGTVLNNADTPTPGQDLAKFADVIAWVSPSLATKYKSFVLSTDLLNP